MSNNICRIEEAETNLRKLLAEHKQMYTAEQQQQEQEEHQQAAAQQRTAEARHRSRRCVHTHIYTAAYHFMLIEIMLILMRSYATS